MAGTDGTTAQPLVGLVAAARAALDGRRIAEARRLLAEAEAGGADPLGIGGESWNAAMLAGDFEAAWRVSDRVLCNTPRAALNRRDLPFHRRAVWDGTPLAGRQVLVHCYHGLGDIVQFCRYLPPLAARVAGLSVQAPLETHGMLRGLPGVGRLLPLDDAVALPAHEVAIELMELPYACRSTLATLPHRVPYLHGATQSKPCRQGGALRVGLAWAAGCWDGGHRSPPSACFAPLAAIPGIEWSCLQRGPALVDPPPGFHFSREGLGNRLEDTAEQIVALDLVISVDTVVAHLAGALAAPAWTLLPFAADWRWLTDRSDSPWYPTMRLYRQPMPGAWEPVLAELAAALATVAAHSRQQGGRDQLRR